MKLKTKGIPRKDSKGKLGLEIIKADQPALQELLGKFLPKGEPLEVTISTEAKSKTKGQQGLYFASLSLLAEVVLGRKPSTQELDTFHTEMKELHGNRVALRLRPGITRPVGMSEADTQDAGVLIDAVFQELAGLDLSPTHQSRARELFQDFWQAGGSKYQDEAEFRQKATLCAACGKGGTIQLAHMESRGANPARKDDPTNWLPLCPSCHQEQHQHGVQEFLKAWPHLAGRWGK